jgi:hypothetical protein
MRAISVVTDRRLSPAQRRRWVLEMARRRVRPGTGSLPERLQSGTMTQWPDLRPVLEGIPWAVVGAVAARLYMPERATRDLDILIRCEDERAVRERLEAAGYRYGAPLAVPGFTVCSPDGAEIDVLLGDAPWVEEALATPRVDPTGLPVLDLPYLVLMKLEASRLQDMADLARMLGLASETERERVRAVVARYAPDALEDLESLIYLGMLEMETR